MSNVFVNVYSQATVAPVDIDSWDLPTSPLLLVIGKSLLASTMS